MNATTTTSDLLAQPVLESDRIFALDVLRGFALLGILVMNITLFAMINAAYMNPFALGTPSASDGWMWALNHVFADQKMMTIFTMLFGAGVVLMTARAEARTGRSQALHYRRMLVLLLIGLLHGYLLWHGDILVWYAFSAMIVYRFRLWLPGRLIKTGLVVLGIGTALMLVFGWSMPLWSADQLEDFERDWQPPQSRVDEELAAFRGSWMDEIRFRAPLALKFQTFVYVAGGLWRVCGVMLLGMGLFKLGVFSATRSGRFYASLVTAAIVVGIPVIIAGMYFNRTAGWRADFAFFYGSIFNYWGSIVVSLGWVGLVMLLVKSRYAAIATPLAAVGRMALTNYLMQTIVCTAIFYGRGLGLFGRLDRVELLPIVVAVWSVQVIASPIWLSHFRFGPAEWLWRSLTYRRAQPMRR